MGNIKLDLKDFKYHSSNAESTTLKHSKDGHLLTLAHKGLSPVNQSIMKALSKMPQQSMTPEQANESRDQKMAQGGKPVPQDSPGMVSSEQCYDLGGVVKTVRKALNLYDPGSKEYSDANPQESEQNVKDKAMEVQQQQPVETPNIQRQGQAEGGEIKKMPHGENLTKHINEVTTQKKEAFLQSLQGRPALDRANEVANKAAGPKKLAEGGAPEYLRENDPNQTSAIQIPSLPTAVENRPQPAPPELTHAQQLYNDAVSKPVFQTTDIFGRPGMIVPNMGNREAEKIGAHGEAPANLNMDAAKAAADQIQREKTQQIYAQQDAEQQANSKNQALQGLGLAPTAQPASLPSTVPADQQPNDALGQNLPAQPDDFGQQQLGNNLQQGYQREQAGITAQAKAQGALGQAQAQQLQQNVDAQQKAQQAYQQSYNELDQERHNLVDDIQNSHIDPDQYWENHSKLAAGIGMILAGFNPTNRPNAATEYLQHQMDNNLKSQVENLGAKKSMLEANLHQFGNLRDAMDMTRLMQASIVQNSLAQAAATAQSPLAKAAALQASGKLQMDYAPLQQQFAMRQAMMKMASGGGQDPNAINHMLGYMRIANPEMAKEMESRYIPGIGIGNVPIPDSARQELIAHQKLDSVGRDVYNYAKTHTNLIPGTAEYNIGVQKAQILQQAIREGLLGTVFRESEKPLLNKFVDDNPAGALKTLSSEPKIKTILDSNAMQSNVLKRNYGLPQSSQPVDQAPQFKIVRGVKYMRGPSGEAVPVK